MTNSKCTFPLLITARKQNIPENYVIVTKLTNGEVIAVTEFAADLLIDEEPEDKVA